MLLEAYDPGHSRANVYRRAIQRERKVETALEEVRAARDRGDLAHGLALLRELPPTVLFEQDVGGLKRALDAEVDSLIARSRADAQAGKWSRVVGSTGVLLAARPNDGFLMALRSHARSLKPTRVPMRWHRRQIVIQRRRSRPGKSRPCQRSSSLRARRSRCGARLY